MDEENKELIENTTELEKTTDVAKTASATTPVKQKKAAAAPKSSGSKLSEGFSNVVAEGKKIVWPSKKDLIKQTITVIFTSLLFGVIIMGIDGGYGFLLKMFAKYLI